MGLSIAFLLAALYLFIPGKIIVKETVSVGATLPGVSRTLTNYDNWKKWWPGEIAFVYNGDQFKPRENAFNAINVDIYSNGDTIHSRMELLMTKLDSMVIIWTATKLTSTNPFRRLSDYRDGRHTRVNISKLLEQVRSFVEKTENIYGLPIHKTKVVDSVLISTRRLFDHKPGIKEIDAMIQSLKRYISKNNSIEKNFPMLNVRKIDSGHYEAMTAIPVDRELPTTKEFETKFMLKGGNILEVQVRGGPDTIEKSFAELENYRVDYKYGSPAIPYQLLVTDRLNEPDTSTWITKIYFPVY